MSAAPDPAQGISASSLQAGGLLRRTPDGVATGFFGVVFLAAATSLPEAAVAFAVRQGAYDLAVGNLLGSNCFNMLILTILDVVDGSAALLSGVDTGVVVGALVGTLLMGQVLLDLLNRPEKRLAYLEPGPTLTLATYAVGLYITYRAMHWASASTQCGRGAPDVPRAFDAGAASQTWVQLSPRARLHQSRA